MGLRRVLDYHEESRLSNAEYSLELAIGRYLDVIGDLGLEPRVEEILSEVNEKREEESWSTGRR